MAGRKVFVGSLPDGMTEEVLTAEFGRYGQVTEVFVKPGCEPGRQWAFVTFATPEQAQLVKESCDRVLTFPGADRACDVMLAKNQGMNGRAADPAPGVYAPPAHQVQQSSGARKIFVGSLPDGIQDDTLRSQFAQYGSIEDIFIKPNCEPGRQWAFISFTTHEMAELATQMCNGILQFTGSIKPCEVKLARNQGMFGQDPMNGAPAGGAVATYGYAPAPVAAAPEPPKKIFVGSLPDGISDPALRAEFSKYGQITDLFMKTTCEPNRQWAFITFASAEQAQFARNSCDKVLMFPNSEKPCEVTMARHQGMFGKDSIEGVHAASPVVPAATMHYSAPAPAPAGGEGPKKVFVGSLPDFITDAMLRAEFSKYGHISDLFLKTTCEPGRQWAFITFTTAHEAQYAKDATDRVLQFAGAEKPCEVMLAKNQGKFGQGPLNQYGGGGAPPVQHHVQHHVQPQRHHAPAALPAPAEVQPPPPTTAPPAHLTPWRMYKTAAGLPYYHNSTTGVTQWEAPPDFQVPGQAAGQQRYSPY